MKSVTMYDSYVDCPECGDRKNWQYSELVYVGKTEDTLNYEQKVSYICRNQDCGYRWEV